MRWSAHLHMLFKEVPLVERFQAAADRGFSTVECWSPFEVELDDFEAAVRDAGVELAGFNLHSGDMPGGDRGFLNRTKERRDVLANAEDAVALAERTGTSRINALVGNQVDGDREAEVDEVVRRLGELGRIAEGSDVTFMVEPLNDLDSPHYLINTPNEAAEVIGRVGHPQVGMLFDAFQVARMGLDPVEQLERHIELVRHIQIADAPGRHAPGTGEIDFPAFFAAVERLGYDGAVGLEYTPAEGEDTDAALAWLPEAER
jgi:hydroxypyruvate isomerase